jgi:hypothetical protein
VRLVGKITNVVDPVFGAIHAEITTEDGRVYTFGLLDSRIPYENWTVGLRVSFDEGAAPGVANYVKLFSVDPAAGRTVVIVAVEEVQYVPCHHPDGGYTDGVEVTYCYWVEDGWRNYSMEMVPVLFSGDLTDDVTREPAHTDFGRSPNVSVLHQATSVVHRASDTPVLQCDGRWHSATAVVPFGLGEPILPGSEVSVRITLRVTTGYSGNGVVQEAVSDKNVIITERVTPPNEPSDGQHHSAIDKWASTEPSW